MNRRSASFFIVIAIIIVLLLLGGAALSVILKGAAALPALPTVPTFDSLFSTITPFPSFTPIAVSPAAATNTLTSANPTQTPFPIFILNGTPVYPTARPTSIPARNFSPTPTPLSALVWTYTPTRTPTVGAPAVVQTCRNVLFPVVTGQQWLYQATGLNRSDSIIMSVQSVNNSQGNIQVRNQTTGSTKQLAVQCEGDVIRSFPSLAVGAIFGSTLDSNLTASFVSGVLAPNEAAFLANNWALAWSSQYLVSGTASLSSNGNSVSVTLNNTPVSVACQTLAAGDAAFETISVGAGTFKALKVICTESGQVTALVNGIPVSGLAVGRSTHWFAPKIGLVKMQVTAVSLTVFDLPFSLLTDNSLELKSFVQAP